MSKVLLWVRGGKLFSKGVALAKQAGCKFNPATKTWERDAEALWAFVDSCKFEHTTREEYLWARGLGIVACSVPKTAVSPATTYQGQASMDAEDSIF